MTKAQDERFARLEAELRAPIAANRALLNEERRCRRSLEVELRQRPDRAQYDEVVHAMARHRHELELQLNGAMAGMRTDLYGENGLAPRIDKAIGDLQDDIKALQWAPIKRILAILGTIAATALALKMPEILEALKKIL